MPHIYKTLEHSDNVVVSDSRNDLFQRCLAVLMQRFTRASEVGYPVEIPVLGQRLLVARVGGLVVDLMEEKNMLALMGHMSEMLCSHFRVRRVDSCGPDAAQADRRHVVETLEAQVFAAQIRIRDPRASLSAQLGRSHSALPFIPVLGAMHGLSTGNHSYFLIIYSDSLHVWTLRVLRMVAQEVPVWLKAVCNGSGAIMGPAMDSLDVVILRGFEMGRLCRWASASPGNVL